MAGVWPVGAVHACNNFNPQVQEAHRQMSNKADGKVDSKKRKWIGTMELAAKLGCHPFSIPRFVKTKPNFPQPVKPFGKNLWDEDEVDVYLNRLLAEREKEKIA
jgi:hypothetical protein